MITPAQKQKLFYKFGLHPNEGVDDNTIRYIQRRLTPEMWVDYINELKNILLDNVDRHEKVVSKLNLDNATTYLFLQATPDIKAAALTRALDIYVF